MAWIPVPGVDPRIRGRWINLSPQRRFVCDLLHFSRKVPSVPSQRRMRLADVIAARGRRPARISWCAIFIKAYGIVAAARPELRRCYLPWIWPHLYEHPINVASFTLERMHRGEPGVFYAKIPRPGRWPNSRRCCTQRFAANCSRWPRRMTTTRPVGPMCLVGFRRQRSLNRWNVRRQANHVPPENALIRDVGRPARQGGRLDAGAAGAGGAAQVAAAGPVCGDPIPVLPPAVCRAGSRACAA